MEDQSMDRGFIRRHTAMELALDVLGRATPGISGPSVDQVIHEAQKIETYLSGRDR